MSSKARTWTVLADGSRIRILLDLAETGRLLPVFGGIFTRPPGADGDVGQEDRRGRSWAESPFAKDIGRFLERGAEEEQFDQLVLIAPPQMLAELRPHLGPQATQRLAAEIDKDLAQLPEGELAARLQSAITA